MKNIALVLTLGAVAFVAGWEIRDRQGIEHPASVAHGGPDAQTSVRLLPEGHPPLLPPGHPPILPEGHPPIGQRSGACPATRPYNEGPSPDEARSMTPPEDLITT